MSNAMFKRMQWGNAEAVPIMVACGMADIAPMPTPLVVWRKGGIDSEDGALVLFENGVLDWLCVLFETDEIICLPSSRHEWIVVPPGGEAAMAQLQEMVRSINNAMVSDRDYLSDSIFKYNKRSGFSRLGDEDKDHE